MKEITEKISPDWNCNKTRQTLVKRELEREVQVVEDKFFKEHIFKND